MLGGLQFRALHHELVESGRMTDRQFHDAILKEKEQYLKSAEEEDSEEKGEPKPGPSEANGGQGGGGIDR